MASMLAQTMPVAALLATLVLLPAPARGAAVTRVASSFEADNPFDAGLALGWVSSRRSARIARERYLPDGTGNGTRTELIELDYRESAHALPFRLAFGLYRGLELSLGFAMILDQSRSWDLTSGRGAEYATATTTSLRSECRVARAGDPVLPSCKDGAIDGGVPLLALPGRSYRAGWSDLGVRLAYAAFDEARDPGLPTLVVGLEYLAPTAARLRPSAATSATNPGSIGERVHRFTFGAALSKRLGPFDPYWQLLYSLPSASASAYSNCEDPSRLGYSENCGTSPWVGTNVGQKPQHLLAMLLGTELKPWEDGERSVGIDVHVGARYRTAGRVYNEMSDALGKLLYTEDYLTLGVGFALQGRPAKWVELSLGFDWSWDSDHLLTSEPIGVDLDGRCVGNDPKPCVLVDNSTGEVNPTFDARFDMPGSRFRLRDAGQVSLMLGASFTY